MSKLWNIAKRYIEPCANQPQTMVSDADVQDILTVVMYADQQSRQSTERFARFLKGPTDHDTLYNVWRFVRKNIRYVKDAPFKEVVRTPGCTIAVKKGDCKSMTVMVGALVRSLGYRFQYKVVFYDAGNPEAGHIYTVVFLPGGEKVIVDPVYHEFNVELPYWSSQIYRTDEAAQEVALSGVQTPTPWGKYFLAALFGYLIVRA